MLEGQLDSYYWASRAFQDKTFYVPLEGSDTRRVLLHQIKIQVGSLLGPS